MSRLENIIFTLYAAGMISLLGATVALALDKMAGAKAFLVVGAGIGCAMIGSIILSVWKEK